MTASLDRVRRSFAAREGLFCEVIDHRFERAGALVDAQLAVGARPLAEDRIEVLDIAAGAERIENRFEPFKNSGLIWSWSTTRPWSRNFWT